MQKNIFLLLFLFASYLTLDAQIDSLRMLNNLKELASDKYEGRNTAEEGNALARDYLTQQLEEMGVAHFDSTYVQPITFWNWMKKEKVEGKNIIGYVNGTTFPNLFIVLSAHYDHVGVKKGKIYNGADDNASGTCALVELADYFTQNPPKHSIVFAFFDAEELGLQGARCFVDEPPVPKDSIILNINMDMVSRNEKNELYICGTYHNPWLKSPLKTMVRTSKLTVLFGHDDPKGKLQDWTSSSDHGAFHSEEIPFLYVGVEDHKDYHKPEDDFENIQPSFYYHATQLVLDAVKIYDENWEGLR